MKPFRVLNFEVVGSANPRPDWTGITNPFMSRSTILAGILLIVACVCSSAQDSTPPPPKTPAAPAVQNLIDQVNATQLRVSPGDEVEITVFGAPEVSTHTRVGSDGSILIPFVGPIKVQGFTALEAGDLIRQRLTAANLVRDPQVSFFVKEYTGEGISVTGEVGKPGLYPALGPHRLLDIIQLAGGPTVSAGRKIVIAHRGHPQDAETVMLSDDPLLLAQANMELQPGDTVIVSKADLVYVLGDVTQPGGYTIDERHPATVLKLITLAKGANGGADLKRARILRRSPSGLSEMGVPLNLILRARSGDVELRPDDILIVPTKHHFTPMTASSAIQLLAQTAVYRGF